MSPNNTWKDRAWEIIKKRAPIIGDLAIIFPRLSYFRLPLICLAVFILPAVAYWDSLTKIEPIAQLSASLHQRNLPSSSARRFTVAVAHIEDDSNGDVEKLIVESLKGIVGVEPQRFDRRSNILSSDRPLDAERKGHENARVWLKNGGQDLVLWGYILPTKEKTVRIFITPRLVEETFEAKILADQSLDFPVQSREALASAVRAQVLANLDQFDPSRNVADELKASIDKLAALIGNWPKGEAKAAMQVALANAYRDFGHQTGDSTYLEMAVAEYQNALPEYSNSQDLVTRTQIRNFLGGTLRILGDQDIERMRQAVSVYGDALKEISRADTPEMWASVQSNLGIALHQIGKYEGDKAKLKLAVEAHRNALTEVEREYDPLNWALIENSLGNTLVTLGGETKNTAELKDAINAFDMALNALPRKSFPLYWAMTKCNRGVALMTLGVQEKDSKTIDSAVSSFSDALGEYSKEKNPLHWALVRHNLGMASHSQFYVTGKEEELRKAVVFFNEALEGRAIDRSPVGWAETQTSLGYTLVLLAIQQQDETQLLNAVSAYKNALKVFNKKQYPQHAELIEQRLAKIDKILELMRQ